MVDGVLVALDSAGRPDRAALDVALAGQAPAFFYVFDLLYAEEWDLWALPLIDRKTILRSLVPELSAVQFVDHVSGDGHTLAAAAGAAGLPALIARKATSTYRKGPSNDWRLVEISPDPGAAERSFEEAVSRGPAVRRRLRITHRNKVYWPEQGYTKGDLIDYYEQVSEALLPHLIDRPLHLYRHPDGIRGKSFYQKQLPASVPAWVDRVDVAREGEPPASYAVCADAATLLYLINLGSIDLHPWHSRRGSLAPPHVVRPVEGATVSMPLDWDELDGDLSLAGFTLKTAPTRLAERGDLFRQALTDRQDLLPAIEALGSYLGSR